jgi:chromosome segregation ATPase
LSGSSLNTEPSYAERLQMRPTGGAKRFALPLAALATIGALSVTYVAFAVVGNAVSRGVMQRAVSQLEQELSIRQARSEELSAAVLDAEAERRRLDTENKKSATELERLQATLQAARDTISQGMSLRQEIASLETRLTERRKDAGDIAKAVAEAEARRAQLNNEIKTLTADRDRRAADLTGLAQNISAEEARRSKAIDEAEAARRLVAARQDERTTIGNQVKSLQSDLASLRDQLTQIAAQREQALQSERQARDAAAALRAEVERLAGDRDGVRAQTAELAARRDTLNTALAGGEGQRRELDRVRVDLEVAQKQRSNIQKDIDTARTEGMTARAELEAVRTERETTRQTIAALAARRDELNTDVAALESKKKTLANIEADVLKARAEHAKAMEAARAELESMRRDRSRMSADLESIQSDITEMRRKRDAAPRDASEYRKHSTGFQFGINDWLAIPPSQWTESKN